jgi:hypothetical protein
MAQNCFRYASGLLLKTLALTREAVGRVFTASKRDLVESLQNSSPHGLSYETADSTWVSMVQGVFAQGFLDGRQEATRSRPNLAVGCSTILECDWHNSP